MLWKPKGPQRKFCLDKNVVYNATVKTDTNIQTYIGMCSTTFKARLGVHKQSLKYEEKNQTALSKYVHKMKREDKQYEINWKIIDRGKFFDPTSGVCQLCIKETYNIIFKP